MVGKGVSEAVESVLALVARGNAVLAEVERLRDIIPLLYRDVRGEGSQVIFDFSYFKNSDAIEAAIEKDVKLQDVDAMVKEEHLENLTRFYQCFESIQRYGVDLVQLISDLEEGKFIQQTVDTVLRQQEGKQLLAEAIFLLGVQLLTVDEQIGGPIRERLIVSYYRYSGEAGHNSHMDTVCELLRSTGYQPHTKRPTGYPETLLARVPVQKSLITKLVGRLRSDDLYSLLPHFPEPSERSTALATQASMLYVLLYFEPEILKQETALMREIVDKYFCDNWVISIYMGNIIWLPEAWDQYKAAKAAITNTTANAEVKKVAGKQGSQLRVLLPRLQEFLTEGTITQDTLLDNVNKILCVIRESNVNLRWLFLHTAPLTQSVQFHKRSRQLSDLVAAEAKIELIDLFNLLLLVARLEQKLRQMYNRVLAERERSWARLRQDCVSRMEELADVFGGKQKLSRIEPNKRLEKWLLARGEQMKSLDVDDPKHSARLAVQLIQALEDAKEFHQLEANLQVTQYLNETKESLLAMVRLTTAQDDILVQLQILSDFSYAWHLIDNLTPLMQEQVKTDPKRVSELRSTFLKLAGAMEGAMVRLGEAGSRDLYPVSQYYSRKLVTYIRNVLQVIPASMFALLEKVVELQSKLEDLPTRLEKDKLKEFSQLDKRFEIARLTHKVSVLSRGILAMRTTLVGVVQIDPKKLLEEGIRRELVNRVATALHKILTFNAKSKDRVGDLVTKIEMIGRAMEGFRKSFEYIQDYINIPGLRLWQEEISRIIKHAIEKEAAGFLKGSGESYSQYQSIAVPIPEFPSIQGDVSRTFMGRLTREILSVTEPGNSVYVESSGSWFALRPPHIEILGPIFVQKLELAVGVAGLAGLNRLLGLMVITNLQRLGTWLGTELQEGSETFRLLSQANSSLPDSENLIPNPGKTYAAINYKLAKSFQILHPALCSLGQLTQLRRAICGRLSSSIIFDSKLLHSCLQGLQHSLLTKAVDQSIPFPPLSESELLAELVTHLQWTGLDDPAQQVYSPASQSPHLLDLLLALVVTHNLARMVMMPSTGFLVGKRISDVDGWIFLSGLVTALNQQHPQVTRNLLDRLQQAKNSFTIQGETQELASVSLFTRFLSQSLNLVPGQGE